MPWIIAAAVLVGLYLWGRASQAAPAPTNLLPPAPAPAPVPTPAPTAAPVMQVPLVPGNVGVLTVPSGTVLSLLPPSGATLTPNGFSSSPPNALQILGLMPNYLSVAATPAFYGAPTIIAASMNWIDSTGTAQTSTMQIAAEAPGIYITLQPNVMANVYIPAVGGQMLFVPPAGGNVTGGAVAQGTGTPPHGQLQAPATVGGPATYSVVGAGVGNGSVTILWTDSTGTAQTSTVGVAAV